MKFLSGWFFPSHWGEPNAEDKRLVDLMTGYWTQFANPATPMGPVFRSGRSTIQRRTWSLQLGTGKIATHSPYGPLRSVRAQPEWQARLDTEVGPSAGHESGEVTNNVVESVTGM
jgi:hypothetical protein